MILKMPVFETLEKINSPPWNPLWAALPAVQPLAELHLPPPALTLAVLTQYTVSGKGTISLLFSPSHARGPSRVFQFKIVSLIPFEKCTYFLTKTFIQIHSVIFLKISGRAQPWSPCGWAAPSWNILKIIKGRQCHIQLWIIYLCFL
jgi:hypothetical protein